MTHQVTVSTRNTVKVLTAAGATKASIASTLQIDPATLTKYYWQELETGGEEVINNMFMKHVSVGQKEDHPQARQCREFVMERRGGKRFQRKDQVELVHPELKEMDRDELRAEARRTIAQLGRVLDRQAAGDRKTASDGSEPA